MNTGYRTKLTVFFPQNLKSQKAWFQNNFNVLGHCPHQLEGAAVFSENYPKTHCALPDRQRPDLAGAHRAAHYWKKK